MSVLSGTKNCVKRPVRTNGKVDVHKDELLIRIQEAVDELGDAEQLQLQIYG